MIYRVLSKTTSSEQPRSTHWLSDVLYCGSDLEEARIAYLSGRATDYGSYGNRAKETVIEQFESEPDDIESEQSEDVEIEE